MPEGEAPPDRYGRGARGRWINLVRLAEAQRRLLWAMLGLVGVWPLTAGAGSLVGFSGPSWDLVGGLGGLAFALLALATVALIARMAMAYGLHPALGVLVGLAAVTPCAGYLILALMNGRVTGTLRGAGVRVGLMGVRAADLNKLRLGVCVACGYDLRGLSGGVCPECGAARAAEPA